MYSEVREYLAAKKDQMRPSGRGGWNVRPYLLQSHSRLPVFPQIFLDIFFFFFKNEFYALIALRLIPELNNL